MTMWIFVDLQHEPSDARDAAGVGDEQQDVLEDTLASDERDDARAGDTLKKDAEDKAQHGDATVPHLCADVRGARPSGSGPSSTRRVRARTSAFVDIPQGERPVFRFHLNFLMPFSS